VKLVSEAKPEEKKLKKQKEEQIFSWLVNRLV